MPDSPSISPHRVHFQPNNDSNNNHQRSPPPTPHHHPPETPDASFDSSEHSSLMSNRSSLDGSTLLSRSSSGSRSGSLDGSHGASKRRRGSYSGAGDEAGEQPDTPTRPGRRSLMDMLRSSVRGTGGSAARRKTSGAHAGNGWQRRDELPGEEYDVDALPYQPGKHSQTQTDTDRGWTEKLYDPRPSRNRSTRLRPRTNDDHSPPSLPRKRSTREMEEGGPSPRRSRPSDEAFKFQGGIFSQLLKLSALPPPPNPYTTAFTAQPSASAHLPSGPQPLPTLESLGINASRSMFHKDYDDGELDSEDPRVTGVIPRRNARGAAEGPFLKMFADGPAGDEAHRQAIQREVNDILIRQTFILKLAKSLMAFGAPSHRIESQLSATALMLSIDAQFIHFPSLVIASFGDSDTRTSETHFIKSSGDLDLGKLHQVHGVYRAIVHDEMDAEEGTRKLDGVLKSGRAMSRWVRMGLAFTSCAMIAPMFFGGGILDAVAAGTLGMGLDLLQGVAGNSTLYSNVFEITIATLISFIARGLSVSGYFCYGATASAGVCLILPGYAILCGSLELASKNLISGSVRMLYAIIYSLFLGFGVTIGSDLFYLVDPPAYRAASAILTYGTETISGAFTSLPSSTNTLLSGAPDTWNGTFTFVNTTSAQLLSARTFTSLACPREADWPWWRQAMPEMYLVGLVPLYSFLTALWLYQPLRSKELPIMVFISSAGFFANNMAARWIWNRDDVVSAIGAFVIGLLGNLYSRLLKGTAFTSMVPGIMFLVPSGISAAGGLAANARDRHQSDAFSEGLLIGARMIQVAIGITVGLFASGMLIYSFGRKKRAALFSF